MDFKDKLILAPMAGVTDLPFRILAKEQGADIVVTEMVSAKGMHYKNKNSVPLLATEEAERPVGAQLFGSEPDIIAEQAKTLVDKGFDFIDLNFGCPVPKIVGNGDGSALMKTPERIGEIVAAVSSAIPIPVTIKIRAGFDPDHINAPEVARIAEQAGAAAVAVHARTREQFYSGKADWSVIKKVKEAVGIPVIGNGDVTCADDYLAIREQTGCDAVMIGRAAKGNPWIFHEIKTFLATGEVPPRPTTEEIVEMMLRQADMMVQKKGEYTGIREMRKHVAWYTQGIRSSSKLREKINAVESYEELCTLVRTRLLTDAGRDTILSETESAS